MAKDPAPGELVHNDKYTIVMISLDKKELEEVKRWAEGYGKSIPSFIKDIIMRELCGADQDDS